jgi:hypothetical protein
VRRIAEDIAKLAELLRINHSKAVAALPSIPIIGFGHRDHPQQESIRSARSLSSGVFGAMEQDTIVFAACFAVTASIIQ